MGDALTAQGIKKLSVAQLRRELEKRNLERSGCKADLVIRLENHLQKTADVEKPTEESLVVKAPPNDKPVCSGNESITDDLAVSASSALAAGTDDSMNNIPEAPVTPIIGDEKSPPWGGDNKSKKLEKCSTPESVDTTIIDDHPETIPLEMVKTLTVVRLRQELGKRGFDKSGLKSELVERLEAHLKECADLDLMTNVLPVIAADEAQSKGQVPIPKEQKPALEPQAADTELSSKNSTPQKTIPDVQSQAESETKEEKQEVKSVAEVEAKTELENLPDTSFTVETPPPGKNGFAAEENANPVVEILTETEVKKSQTESETPPDIEESVKEAESVAEIGIAKESESLMEIDIAKESESVAEIELSKETESTCEKEVLLEIKTQTEDTPKVKRLTEMETNQETESNISKTLSGESPGSEEPDVTKTSNAKTKVVGVQNSFVEEEDGKQGTKSGADKSILKPALSLGRVRKLTVIQLRHELEKLGLEKSGLKTQLIERLEKYIQEQIELENISDEAGSAGAADIPVGDSEVCTENKNKSVATQEEVSVEEVATSQDIDFTAETAVLPENNDIKEGAMSKDGKDKEVVLPENGEVKEVSSPENGDVKEVALPVDDDVKEVTLAKDDDIKEIVLPGNNDVTEVALPDNDDVREVVLSENDVTEVAMPENDDVTEVPLSENDDVTEIPLSENDDVTEIPLPENDDVTEVALPVNDDVTEVALPENDDMTEMALPENDDVTEVALPADDDVEEVSLIEDDDVEEVSLIEEDDVEEVTLPNDDGDIEEVAASSDQVTEPGVAKRTKNYESDSSESPSSCSSSDDEEHSSKRHLNKIPEQKRAKITPQRSDDTPDIVLIDDNAELTLQAAVPSEFTVVDQIEDLENTEQQIKDKISDNSSKSTSILVDEEPVADEAPSPAKISTAGASSTIESESSDAKPANEADVVVIDDEDNEGNDDVVILDPKPSIMETDKQVETPSANQSTSTNQPVVEKNQSNAPADNIPCLWVSDISLRTKALHLRNHFAALGRVLVAKVVSPVNSPKCFGFVIMSNAEEAKKCVQHRHRSLLHKMTISVQQMRTDIDKNGNDGQKTDRLREIEILRNNALYHLELNRMEKTKQKQQAKEQVKQQAKQQAKQQVMPQVKPQAKPPVKPQVKPLVKQPENLPDLQLWRQKQQQAQKQLDHVQRVTEQQQRERQRKEAEEQRERQRKEAEEQRERQRKEAEEQRVRQRKEAEVQREKQRKEDEVQREKQRKETEEQHEKQRKEAEQKRENEKREREQFLKRRLENERRWNDEDILQKKIRRDKDILGIDIEIGESSKDWRGERQGKDHMRKEDQSRWENNSGRGSEQEREGENQRVINQQRQHNDMQKRHGKEELDKLRRELERLGDDYNRIQHKPRMNQVDRDRCNSLKSALDRKKIEYEIREELENEARLRYEKEEKELQERLDKERRDRLERELRAKIAKEIKEREERERAERVEREQREKEKLEREEKERKEKAERKRKEQVEKECREQEMIRQGRELETPRTVNRGLPGVPRSLNDTYSAEPERKRRSLDNSLGMKQQQGQRPSRWAPEPSEKSPIPTQLKNPADLIRWSSALNSQNSPQSTNNGNTQSTNNMENMHAENAFYSGYSQARLDGEMLNQQRNKAKDMAGDPYHNAAYPNNEVNRTAYPVEILKDMAERNGPLKRNFHGQYRPASGPPEQRNTGFSCMYKN